MKLKEFLKNKIPDNKIEFTPSSFDVIGDICIIEIKDEVKKYEKLIANSLLELNKNIKSVFKKTSARKGKHRTYKLKLLAGINNKETIYKENGVLFKLDVEKCYFTPRWSNERLRISKLVKKNENILVMFSGIGSFTYVILKNSTPKIIYNIEINKTAHKYALENLKINRFDENKVKLINSDVKKALPKINLKFDRILMPLPKESEKYFDLAFKSLNKNGVIHYYTFLEEPKKKLSDLKLNSYWKKQIKENLKDHKFKIQNIIKCGVYAARIYRVCVEIKK